MSDAPAVEVVAAVVRAGGRILVTRRPLHKHLGGLWEFPGGKIEPGEVPERALEREVAEELGIAIAVDGLVKDVTHAYPEKTVRIRFYACRHLSGEVTHHDVADHRWATAGELHGLAFPEADRELIAELVRDQRGASTEPDPP